MIRCVFSPVRCSESLRPVVTPVEYEQAEYDVVGDQVFLSAEPLYRLSTAC